ncbi:MAG: hypothetical protein O2917_07495 [Acidobacteria bacterium]|nr:hypothetical protein [Acidobacteriota bacterium]
MNHAAVVRGCIEPCAAMAFEDNDVVFAVKEGQRGCESYNAGTDYCDHLLVFFNMKEVKVVMSVKGAYTE